MRSTEGRGEGFVPNVLQQLEGGRSKASIAVQDKGCEGTAPLLGVGAVLGDLELLACNHGIARSHVDIGGCMRVDARDVKVDCAIKHVDLTIR